MEEIDSLEAALGGPGKHTDHDAPIELVHPVYLDVPMAISFIAALEGGVSFEEERHRTRLAGRERSRELAARAGLPTVASLAGLGLDLSGRFQGKDRAEESEESMVLRQHTEASLFNLLRHALQRNGYVRQVTSPSDLNGLSPGDLVEVSGEATGNPLEQVLDFLDQILPYLGLDEQALKRAVSKNPKKSGNPQIASSSRKAGAQESAEGMLLALKMRQELQERKVKDFVLAGRDNLRAVLTLSTEFFTEQTAEYLLAGQFTAIGKVTRVLTQDEDLNLTRRTAFGLAEPDTARETIQEAAESGVNLNVGDPIVEAPAIQLLPVAVFI